MLVEQAKNFGTQTSDINSDAGDGVGIKCVFPRKIESDFIVNLPLAAYTSKTVLVESDEVAETAVCDILKETLLGFDTESKPTFKKGHSNPVSILQLGGVDCVWVFRMALLEKSYPKIYSILENGNIKKVGVAVKGDISALNRLYPFSPAGFEDISDKTRALGIVNTGLRNLAGLFLGKRISKSAQMSNWAADSLTQKQISYAATDAWISRDLHLAVAKVLREKRYGLEPEIEPKPLKKNVLSKFWEKLRGKFF